MNATFTSPMSFVGATRRTTALLRKITSNEYFLSMQEHTQRYHTSQK